MQNSKRNLQGSPLRDRFKRLHKELGSGLYALDIDFALVSKEPEGIVAFLDIKCPGEAITFSEVLGYNRLLFMAPVYILRSDKQDIERGRFEIFLYHGGDWRPEPPVVRLRPVASCADWNAYGEWERAIRRDFADTVPVQMSGDR